MFIVYTNTWAKVFSMKTNCCLFILHLKWQASQIYNYGENMGLYINTNFQYQPKLFALTTHISSERSDNVCCMRIWSIFQLWQGVFVFTWYVGRPTGGAVEWNHIYSSTGTAHILFKFNWHDLKYYVDLIAQEIFY